jgi:voltage-dependent anion channel protein 2
LNAVDILTDDYTSKVTLKCKKNAGPVAVTIETEQGEGGSLTSKVGTKFSYAKFNVDKGQLTAAGDKVLETSLKLTPEIKLSFKANKGADLLVDYVKGNVYATGCVDVMDMTKASSSACITLPSGLKVGGDASYGFSGSKAGLNSFGTGLSYTHGPVFASLTATGKFSQYNIGLLYKVNDNVSLASMTTHTSSKACNVLGIGGLYKAPAIGTIKAKFGMDHVVHACLIREIAPKVTLVASASVSPSDVSTFKPGMSITM